MGKCSNKKKITTKKPLYIAWASFRNSRFAHHPSSPIGLFYRMPTPVLVATRYETSVRNMVVDDKTTGWPNMGIVDEILHYISVNKKININSF